MVNNFSLELENDRLKQENEQLKDINKRLSLLNEYCNKVIKLQSEYLSKLYNFPLNNT